MGITFPALNEDPENVTHQVDSLSPTLYFDKVLCIGAFQEAIIMQVNPAPVKVAHTLHKLLIEFRLRKIRANADVRCSHIIIYRSIVVFSG